MITPVDIDECFEAAFEPLILICDSGQNVQCVNTNGSFECVCVPGYKLGENGTCERKQLVLQVKGYCAS